MKIKKLLPLFFITLIAAILRFFLLDRLPISPNWDEISHGYNAYSLIKTGADEWGKQLPLIFRAFGDYKLPVYIYLTTIPVWLLGLSVFSVRLVSALAGSLAVIGIYLLTKELIPVKKFNTPLLSAFLLAISPWHFFISRPALEANLALTLIIFGFYYLLRFYGKKSSLLPSVLLLGLSLHTYNTARVFVPMLVLVSLIIYRFPLREIFKESAFSEKLKNIFAIILAIFFSSLVLFQIYIGEGTARYDKLKILSPATVFQIGEKRAQSDLPPVISKLLFNRPLFFVTTFSKNYIGYFSPQFFSQTWGGQFQFAIPKENLLTLPVFLLSLLGLLFSFSKVKTEKGYRFLYLWLLFSPVAASLTIDPPQALRPNPMIPALIIFACLGLSRLKDFVPSKYAKILTVFVLITVSISFGRYLWKYQGEYATKYSSSWQYGYGQVITYIKEHGSLYDRIFITKRYGEPHIFYAFYSKISPQSLQPNSNNIRFSKSDWFWTDKIDNVYFVNDWQIPTTPIASLTLESGDIIPAQRSLLITSPDHIPVNAHVIESINFLDGSPAFIIASVP